MLVKAVTIIACVFHYSVFNTNHTEYVTGELVEKLTDVYIVDISNAANALNLHDDDYTHYIIPKESCVIGKTSKQAKDDAKRKYDEIMGPKHLSDFNDEYTEAGY